MFRYLLKRLGQMIVILMIVVTLVFVLTNFIGDPVNMLVSEKATEEVRENVRRELGLDQPLHIQFGRFIEKLLKADFGKSYTYRKDVLVLIKERLPATLEMVLISVLLALFISIPLGVFAGAYPKKHTTKAIMGGSILGISLPTFFIGIVLIYVFAVKLKVLPSSGRGPTQEVFGMRLSLFTWKGLKHIILPAVTLDRKSGV